MAELTVDVVAADRGVWTGTARAVTAPAHDGELGILAGHTPLFALMAAGNLRIRTTANAEVTIAIAGGFLSVDSNRVTVVADSASAPVTA